jgi:hypothetical protein
MKQSIGLKALPDNAFSNLHNFLAYRNLFWHVDPYLTECAENLGLVDLISQAFTEAGIL